MQKKRNFIEIPDDGIEIIGREGAKLPLFLALIFLLGIFFANKSYAGSIYKKVIRSETFKEYKNIPSFKRLPLKSKYYVVQFMEDLFLNQQQNIFWAYEVGKNYGYGYTLAAIAWKESLGGAVDINLFDKPWGSCGIFHNNLKTVVEFIRQSGQKFIVNKFNLNKLCAELQHNPEYSLIEAVKVLNDAKKRYKNNWLAIWAHYNGGWRKPNYKYAKDIYYRIQALNFIINYERRQSEDIGYDARDTTKKM
jgi:hypothetical protein